MVGEEDKVLNFRHRNGKAQNLVGKEQAIWQACNFKHTDARAVGKD